MSERLLGGERGADNGNVMRPCMAFCIRGRQLTFGYVSDLHLGELVDDDDGKWRAVRIEVKLRLFCGCSAAKRKLHRSRQAQVGILAKVPSQVQYVSFRSCTFLNMI
jgi:hypothetical protein